MTKGDLQRMASALDTFMSSEVYPRVIDGWRQELAGLEASLLMLPPTTPEVVALCNQNHGKRESLLSSLSYFEGLRDTLKTEIAKFDDDPNNIVVQE